MASRKHTVSPSKYLHLYFSIVWIVIADFNTFPVEFAIVLRFLNTASRRVVWTTVFKHFVTVRVTKTKVSLFNTLKVTFTVTLTVTVTVTLTLTLTARRRQQYICFADTKTAACCFDCFVSIKTLQTLKWLHGVKILKNLTGNDSDSFSTTGFIRHGLKWKKRRGSYGHSREKAFTE